MLFSDDAWPRIKDASITLTFRAWMRPQARTGGRLRTPVGVLAIDDVSVVPVDGRPNSYLWTMRVPRKR